ncbi:MAG: hypothetical protein NC313_11420 [Butyrivibrio sp.]|nr:hypothetical protein [Butyrivibrio sp.]
MKYFTLLKANIKSQKGSFIGIFMLIFIITVSLCAVLSIWRNSGIYEAEQIERVGFGDITFWITQLNENSEEMEGLLNRIREIDDVDTINTQEFIACDVYRIVTDEKTTTIQGSLCVLAYGEPKYDYNIYNESLTGIEENEKGLNEGEIYVSPSLKGMYGADIGDIMEIEIDDERNVAKYVIKGFFEDPVDGSALMGIKDILMLKEDMQKLGDRFEEIRNKADEKTGVYMLGIGSMIHISKTKDSSLNMGEFQRLLNEKTGVYSELGFAYTKSSIMGFMLILQNIFSAFLLVFVLVLLVIAVIIIGHSINSSIEQDYVDMGIMKAVGYTGMKLRMLQLFQYMLIVLIAMALGVPASVFVVRVIESMLVTTTGLIVPSTMPVALSFMALGAVGLIIAGFVIIRTKKIEKVLPIQAIRGGASDVYFKSRLTAQIHQKALNFWLAYRQLISGKKQYISACFISVLLVFFLALVVRLDAWLGEDGKGLMDCFNAAQYDFGVRYENEAIREEAEEWIDAEAGIINKYEFVMTRGTINQIEYMMNVVSEPEYFNILEGRTCLYKNEIVITDLVSKELEIGIGDTVLISFGGKELEFIISGVYQCANDMGTNFGISRKGVGQFIEDNELDYYRYYQLKEPELADKLADDLHERYKEDVVIDNNTWSGLDVIVDVMSALVAIMYVITVVFILITVYLTGSKVLYREQHDLSIYKSLGFASGKLRFAFALRFGIAAAMGSVIGIVLSIFLTDPMVSKIIAMCGVSHFSSDLNPLRMAMLAVVVSGLFFIFAYLSSGRIKKTGAGILIVE